MSKFDLVSRGAMICDPGGFTSLQSSSGTASLESTGFPTGPTKAVKLTYPDSGSTYGQLAYSSPYFTLGLTASTITGLLIEVYNPQPYPVPFIVELYNDSGTRQSKCNMCCDVSSGWQLCWIPKSNFAANYWVITDKLRFVRIIVDQAQMIGWTVGGGSVLFFGRVYFNPTQYPVFLLATDDGTTANLANGAGYPTGYPSAGGNYKSICDYYGFSASAYIVPSFVGTSGYLTWSQILSLRDAGWTIGSHSNTHPTDASNNGLRLLGPYGVTQGYTGAVNDDSAIYSDIVTAISTLVSHGLTDAIHFALPQGGWDQYVRTACIRAGLKSVRAISDPTHGFPIRGALHVGGGNPGPQSQSGWFELAGAIQVDGTPTLSQLQAYVDEVIRVGATGSCYTHGIDAATASKFDGLCAYLKVKQDLGLIRVMTVSDYYDLLYDWSGSVKFSTMPALTIGTGAGTVTSAKVQ